MVPVGLKTCFWRLRTRNRRKEIFPGTAGMPVQCTNHQATKLYQL